MQSFKLYKPRDAWGTIRGYVYQVQTTIYEWIRLRPGEELHLEFGEDIDRIQSSLAGEETGLARLLGQVKYRERAVSLRSVDVVQAISSFFQHRQANEGQKLRFRFLTNARVGRETNSALPDGRAGVEVWEDIRNGNLTAEARAAAVTGIRGLLVEGARSDATFFEFLTKSEDAALVDFIESIEWSVRRPDIDKIQELIESELLGSGRASDEANSQQMLERLFFHAFNVLSRKGLKVLTLNDFNVTAKLSALSTSEKTLLSFLNQVLQDSIARLDEIGERVERHEVLLVTLSSQVESMMGTGGHVVDYQLGIEQWGIPPPVRKMVNRESTVEHIEGILATNDWCAIHGDIQSGKTHLAVAIARKWAGKVVWASLSGLTPIQASQQLDTALKSVNGSKMPISVPEFLEATCRELGKGSLIVLDGLPRSQSLDFLERRLISLEQACRRHRVKLLSTSAVKISLSVVDRLNGKLAHERAPRFSSEDRRELFRLSGAPESVLDESFQKTIGLLTHDHPVLLNSVVRYLERKNWRVETQAWHGLLERAYVRDLIADADQLLKTTVPDGESRDLLYRLNLSTSPFTEKEVTEVAEVEPAVSLPLERFRDALGAWIETAGDAAFRSSPLLASLGHLNLTSSTIRAVHMIFGSRFLKKRRITPVDALESFSHFYSAREFSTAAAVLIVSLNSFQKIKNRGAKDGGISEVWVEGKLPDEIEMTTRLYLRSLQISVRFQLGKDYLSLVGDLDALLDQASEKDATGILGSCLTVVLATGLTNAPLALKYIKKALQTAKLLGKGDGKSYELPNDLRISSLLWAFGAGCDTEETLKEWFKIVGELSSVERSLFFRGKMAEEGCSTICDGIWLREEAKKEAGGRDWGAVLDWLGVIEAQGEEWKTQELATAAVRAQIVIHTDYLKNMEEAVRLAETRLSRPDASALTKFLLGQAIGRAYLDAGDYSKSLEWLTPVTSLPVLSFPRLRMRASLEAGAAASRVDSNRALEFANRAVDIAMKYERVRELETVIALAEKTVALWYCNDRLSSFASWEETLTRMLECETRDQKWKRLFVLLGHASGFFCSMASTERPPGADYVPPTSGFFLNEREHIEDLYDPKKEWFIPAQLAMFAEGVGRIDAASEWASRAVDLGRRLGGGDISEGLVLYAVPQAIADDRFGDALELALSGADSLTRAFVTGTSESKRQPTQEEWKRAETKASGIGLVPSVFRLATLWLRDREKFQSAVLSVIDKCRDLEKRARSSGIWSSAAQAFEEAFVDNCNWRSLYEKSNELNGKGFPAARVIYFLGASLHAGSSDSLALQMALFPFLEETYGHYGIYRRSVVPFVVDFWLRNVDTEAFQYSQPLVTKKRLEELTQKSGDQLEKAILSEVAAGLRIRVSADGRTWMDRAKGDGGTQKS